MQVLKGKLPTYNVNEPIVKLNEREEKTICLIINTADYCQTMTTYVVIYLSVSVLYLTIALQSTGGQDKENNKRGFCR